MPKTKRFIVEDTRRKSNKYHKWSENETSAMLEGIIEYLKQPKTWFERPTARLFYGIVKRKFIPNMKISWELMKSKMQYLKKSYVKARNLKNSFGKKRNKSELYLRARLENMCQFYHLLEQIFVSDAKLDPYWRPRCIENSNNRAESKQFDGKSQYFEPLEMKGIYENFLLAEEVYDDVEAKSDFYSNDFEELCEDTTFVNYEDFTFGIQQADMTHDFESLGERWFRFEKQKAKLNYELELRQIRLEENFQKFEREKLITEQKLNKYAANKQAEAKNFESLNHELCNIESMV